MSGGAGGESVRVRDMKKNARQPAAEPPTPPAAAAIAEALAGSASVRVEVVGEGMLAETRRMVSGPALEGEIRRHFRARQAALDAAGDPFAALFAPALENARAIIAACTEQPPARNSEADIAARMIADYELARAANARGDAWNFGVLAAKAGDLAAELRLVGKFNKTVITRQRSTEALYQKNKREAAGRRRATMERYAPLQLHADKIMAELKAKGEYQSKLTIAANAKKRYNETANEQDRFTEQPDTIKRRLNWANYWRPGKRSPK